LARHVARHPEIGERLLAEGSRVGEEELVLRGLEGWSDRPGR
jgi:hypothetical protein